MDCGRINACSPLLLNALLYTLDLAIYGILDSERFEAPI